MNYSKVANTQFLLKITYAIVPIIVGLDKCFTGMIADWAMYTSPLIMEYIPFSLELSQFLMLIGVIEIAAGLLVWFLPIIGAYTVAAWMVLIIINLASMNMYYDIIARDVVITIGALSLAWLSEALEGK